MSKFKEAAEEARRRGRIWPGPGHDNEGFLRVVADLLDQAAALEEALRSIESDGGWETFDAGDGDKGMRNVAGERAAAALGGTSDPLDLSLCPYYQGTGFCESGCHSEPSCMTDRPRGGWPSENVAADVGAASIEEPTT